MKILKNIEFLMEVCVWGLGYQDWRTAPRINTRHARAGGGVTRAMFANSTIL